MTSETRTCQNCRNSFVIEPDDFAFYGKVGVPPPTFCPTCREQRRIAFRNERALYRRKCDLCGKEVVARVSPDKPYPMYCNRCWWGDGWDPLSYGRAYDFSKPFFEQFKELLFSTPHFALGGSNNVASDWVNQETDDKNCYLNVGGHFNEDSAYNTYEIRGKDSFDNFWIFQSQLCYECVHSAHCYRALYSRNCADCRDVAFCSDCRNCSNCLGCAGLRSKQYHLLNKAVSKEEYETFLKEHPLSSRGNVEKLAAQAEAVWRSVPNKYAVVVKSVNVSGNYITESKNAYNVWSGDQIENSKHFFIAAGVKDSYDGTSIGWSELSYECAHTVGLYESKFNHFSFGGKAEARQSTDMEYAYSAMNCHHCFGCANIKNQEYCILNKRYSREEYEALVSKVKEQMKQMPFKDKAGRVYSYGEHLPIELSPYGYNETAAMDYYPLMREEAREKEYPWSDYEVETKYDFSAYEVPDDVRDVKDDILEKVLKCEVSGKAYKIIPMEFAFYRRVGIPVPRRAPRERHKDRMAKLLPRKLFDRMCECPGAAPARNGFRNTATHQHGVGKCGAKISTPYAPDRPELVYCEKCYQSEVV